MVFSSVLFLFRFLPIFMICYYVAPRGMKNLILLFGSLFFYAWGEPVYVLLMLFSIAVDYFNGRMIERFRGTPKARLFLLSSVVINLFVLGFFKYADFLIGTVNAVFGADLPLLNLPLPIGISFYTFQTMSYTIDVYRGEAKVQKNLLDFSVFVTMFPQLIAGPIVKYRDVARELRSRSADICAISHGLKRFCVGLGKKVLLANQMGQLWTQVSAYTSMSAMTAWLGITAFALQIYFDFSGYSDMAIGLGEMMGFHFPENFNYPYISTSVTEFWRRWHISLGSWFREYVYIPLGGNRKGRARQLFNILIVWMLTGIWHGAGWNFLLWGLWFALFLSLEKLFLGKVLKALPGVVGFLYNTVVVLLGWVMFELGTLGQIWQYFQALTGGGGLYDRQALYLGRQYVILFFIAAVAATPFPHRLAERLEQSSTGVGTALYRLGEKVIPAAILLLSVAGVVDASYNPFLYFRF